VPDVSGVGIETGDRLVVEPTGHRVQRAALLVAITVCAMKVADEDHPGGDAYLVLLCQLSQFCLL